jgi:hypothetical protein
MAIAFARILFTIEDVPGSQGLREWFFAAGFLTAGHTAVTVAETRARRTHRAGRPTLIIGAGRVARLLAGRLLASPEIGLRPVGSYIKILLLTLLAVFRGAASSDPDVSIVIVAHSVRNELKRCLGSIRDFAELPVQTILVDNASTDGPIPWVRRSHRRWR